MKHETETEIETIIRKLRRNAMEDLIATTLGTPTREGPLFPANCRQADADPQRPEQSVQRDNLDLRRFVAGWLRLNKRLYAGNYLERVLISVSRQLAEPHAWGIRYLDMELA